MSIYSFSGNPFVDAGIAVMMAYCKRERPEDITIEDINKVCEFVEGIYLTPQWAKCLFSIFPNNAVTNPSNKTPKIKREKLDNFLESLSNDIKQQEQGGNCIGCGRRNINRVFSKTYVPLTGSGSLRNFYSYAGTGADYCSACAFAIQVSPLAYYMCCKLMLIHPSNFNVMYDWAKICLREINKQVSMDNFSGCYNEGYTNPVNAVFHIAGKLIDEYEDELGDDIEIIIYYFTNYNQGPELDVYRIPSKIFRFLKHMHQFPNSIEWQRIVKNGYHLENLNWLDTYNEDTYKNFRNTVYTRLLNDDSIASYFFEKGKRRVIGDFMMLSLYLEDVKGMDKERIGIIKKVADRIAGCIKKADNLKRLEKLEMAASQYAFRNQLRLIAKEMLKMEHGCPLFTLDEYVNYLFPDINWRETRDLILFRTYENLLDWLKEKDMDEIPEDLVKEE